MAADELPGVPKDGVAAVMLPRWMGILLLVAGSWPGGPAGAAVPAAPPVALAADAQAGVALNRLPHALVARGSVSIREVAAGGLDARLRASDGGVVAFSGDNELWIPLRLHNPSNQPAAWQLLVALPSIDEVTLFEARGSAWAEFSAGDRVAQSQWSRPGRFPRFSLRLEAGETRQLFVRVRNAFAAPVPAWLMGEAAAEAADERSDVGFGIVVGAIALLVAACLIQAALYRDTAYFLYGAYALLLGLAFASLSGLASRHLWGDYPQWADASKYVFPLAGAGVSVWLVRALCRVGARGRTLARASALLGGLVIGLAAVIAALRVAMPSVAAAGMLMAAATVLVMAVWAWKRGDPMGGWVFAAHTPLIAVTALIVLRMFGVAPMEFDANILLSASIGVMLPLLLVALHLRSKEFLAVQIRAREMPSIDPLTGLLAPRPFGDRVRAAIGRWRRSRHNAVVLYVRLANHPRIRELYGSAVAEQNMIRAAMKLQRLMPDSDCIGRVGESTMGLIFETVTARPAVMERASRLVAHGLMPLQGLKPEVTLNIHVAACVLAENALEADALQAALESMLSAMSPRTRKPIRFLEPGAAGPGGVERDADSSDETAPDTLAA